MRLPRLVNIKTTFPPNSVSFHKMSTFNVTITYPLLSNEKCHCQLISHRLSLPAECGGV